MGLRFTTVDARGELGPEVLLDERVCDCCQTGAARSGASLVAVYRDRSAEEVRDIAWVRSAGDAWSTPAIVGGDGWKIEGCPVNGPALDGDASGRAVVAWFGAPEEGAHVRAAFSHDEGATWSAPIGIDDGRPIGRVDAVLLPGGEALVSWLGQTSSGTQLLARRVSASGADAEAQPIGESDAARSGGFPRMAVSGDEVLFAWRGTGEAGGLRLATARVAR
jgi:hypothetical protein